MFVWLLAARQPMLVNGAPNKWWDAAALLHGAHFRTQSDPTGGRARQVLNLDRTELLVK